MESADPLSALMTRSTQDLTASTPKGGILPTTAAVSAKDLAEASR